MLIYLYLVDLEHHKDTKYSHDYQFIQHVSYPELRLIITSKRILAFHNDQAIGHILFTRACFEGQQEQPMMHILAPLAVTPEYQRQGVGGLLIIEGLRLLKERGSNLVFVLGHKEYYPKYGFMPHAVRLGYPAPYLIPESEYWMVQPIGPIGFEIGKGKIRCSDVLNRPEHWRDEESDR